MVSLALLSTVKQPFYPGGGCFASYWNQLNPLHIFLILFINLFLLGQDWICFLGLDHGVLRLTLDINLEALGVASSMFVSIALLHFVQMPVDRLGTHGFRSGWEVAR